MSQQPMRASFGSGVVGFFRRQIFRYGVISGTYMLTTFENVCLHILIFSFLFLVVRYMSGFFQSFEMLKDA
jgi:hypothetical protein